MTTPLLEIRDLHVRFRLRDATVQAVAGLSLDVHKGELLAIVGESGCGKSVLAHALLGARAGRSSALGVAGRGRR